MMTILKLSILSTSLWQASVATMDGQSVSGTVTSISAKSIAVTSDASHNPIPLDSVLQITFDGESSSSGKPTDGQAVYLADGSVLAAKALQASADEIQFSGDVLIDVRIKRSHLRAVRLQSLDPEFELQWGGFLKRQDEKDLLIIHKKNSEGLDFLAGNVAAVNDKEVTFFLDEDEIPVPLGRVFGVVFSQESTSTLTGSTVVRLMDGQNFKASDIEFSDGNFDLTSSWDQSFRLPVAAVYQVDFSSGRLHYLSSLEPITEQYNGLDPTGQEWGTLFDADRTTRTGLSSQWRMSRDHFMNNGRPPLTLRGTTYDRGLCVFPDAKIEYALDRKYSKMTAIVGVDDDVAFHQPQHGEKTAVLLKIEADSEVLFEQLIPAVADPVILNLPLDNRNTLTISVQFGDGSSVCDYLDLANAVLIVKPTSETQP